MSANRLPFWLMLLIAVCFSFFAASPARADGLIVISNPPHPIPGHFSFAPLEVSYHKVDCTIDDQLAVTSVDQEFYNPNAARLEGDYIFPVPKEANINKFSMDIDGKMVEAELLPAEKARAIYEEIVRKAKDPALLEYAGRAMFRVHIFPIEPNSKKRIQLKYTELLKADNNLMDYHYTLNTEKYSAKPLREVSLKITIKSSQPLTTLYSPTHSVEVKRHDDTNAVVGYEAKDVRPDTDFHLFIGRKATPVGISLLTYKPDSDGPGYFVLLAAPTLSQATKPMPKDVVFVMDTSGSMSADHKIEQTKRALKFCITSLNKEDRFDIARFSTEAEPFFKTLTDATDANRTKALEFTDGMKASGGTAIQDALAAALAERPVSMKDGAGMPLTDRPFIVVFMTDGQPTVGEQNPDRLLSAFKDNKLAANVRLFSFGVGTDVNTKLLDELSRQSRGYAQYVLPNEDIEIAMSNFFSKVQDPVLANLKVDLGAVAISKLYPRELPDLFKGDQLIAFGTYVKGGSSAITITGMVNGKEEKFVQDAKFEDKTDSSKDWIGKLWATRRVGFLLDEIRLHGESKELKDEVAELARKFGIVTPYTAMLIIEDEKARGVPVAAHTMGDMERDTVAMDDAAHGTSSIRAKADTGRQAVANSINNEKYREARSLEEAQAAGEQKEGRLAFADQNGSALRRSYATPSPAAAPGTVGPVGGAGQWAGAVDATRAPATAVPGVSPAVPPNNEQQNQGYRVVTNYAQQNRVVNDRAFYLNGNQWSDARVQKAEAAKAEHVKIKFNSPEYFTLLKDHPEAAAWLALGNNVSFELNGKIYDVMEETAAPAPETKQ